MFSHDGIWMTLSQMETYKKKKAEEALKGMEKDLKEVKIELKKEVKAEVKKEFICSVCNKKCASQWHLEKHFKSHK